MIIGAHSIIYSRDADADRAFLKDVLGFPHVDVGGGWLIFGRPPGEVAVHPGEDSHELYLMTDDVAALVASMEARGIACDAVSQQPWGLLTSVALPGGSKLGIYQPRHARPPAHSGYTRFKKAGGKPTAESKVKKRKIKPSSKKRPTKKPKKKSR